MTINKTQQFLYFQNKAKHYDTIKNMKSHVEDKLDKRFIKTLSYSQNKKQEQSPNKKRNRLIPFMKEFQIKEENQNMINRLVKLFKSERTQVKAQGDYSRFNREERKFRQRNPYNNQLNRTIQIGNNQMQARIKNAKPKIGSSVQWKQHFGKTIDVKRNMSRYFLESNRSKASLHISVVDDYMPRYYQSFLNTSSIMENNRKSNKSLPKQIQITQQGLLLLPNIKSKLPVHQVKHTKVSNKLIFDRSKTSLLSPNKSQTSLISQSKPNLVNNPEKEQKTHDKKENKQNRQKRRLLDFKFSEVGSENSDKKKQEKEEKIKKVMRKEQKQQENQSTLKYQKTEEDKSEEGVIMKGENITKENDLQKQKDNDFLNSEGKNNINENDGE